MSKWISVKESLPEPETEVLIAATRNGHVIITTAIYEDGTILTDESDWYWDDDDSYYNEEADAYIIPEGWWEYRYYSPYNLYDPYYDVCENRVDDPVTHWQPVPEFPNCGSKMDKEDSQ